VLICCFSSFETEKIKISPNLDSLKYYTLLSYSTYCSAPSTNISNFGCFWCKQLNSSSNVKVRKLVRSNTYDLFGIVFETPTEIVVGFRGTVVNDILNWISDLNVDQVSYPRCLGCKVHHGFYQGYQDLAPKVVPFVKNLQSLTGKPVVSTGHSLGGALAVHFAADMAFEGIPTSLVTLGQPRVGNAAFAAWYPTLSFGKLWRITNRKDIVPHVPLKLFHYQHFPEELWFQSNYVNFQMCSMSNGEDPNCSDGHLDDSVTDHFYYLGYYQRLGKQHQCD